MKTGHFPDLSLGHQNGQRNEATQCVNESGILKSPSEGTGSTKGHKERL
jgi:hypothetical protein